MSNDKKDKPLVKDLFSKVGLKVQEIPTKPGVKTPDFEIYKDEELIAVCETKSVRFDNWLVDDIRNNPDVLTVGERKDPIFNRLSDDICTAAKQFESYGSDRKIPRILTFVNYDKNCGFNDLRSTVTGNFYAHDGTVHPLYKNVSEGRAKGAIEKIDLCLWIEAGNSAVWHWSLDGNEEERREPRKFWVTPSANLPQLNMLIGKI